MIAITYPYALNRGVIRRVSVVIGRVVFVGVGRNGLYFGDRAVLHKVPSFLAIMACARLACRALVRPVKLLGISFIGLTLRARCFGFRFRTFLAPSVFVFELLGVAHCIDSLGHDAAQFLVGLLVFGLFAQLLDEGLKRFQISAVFDLQGVCDGLDRRR